MSKTKCGHFWKVVDIRNIMPDCSIVDLAFKCTLCGKGASGSCRLEVQGK